MTTNDEVRNGLSEHPTKLYPIFQQIGYTTLAPKTYTMIPSSTVSPATASCDFVSLPLAVDEADATMKQSASEPISVDSAQESCLVQIYPPDVVDGMMLIEEDRLEIGREMEADFVLLDNSVSRRHAEVCRVGNGYVIRDLGSTNGTLVNGNLISETRLASGDTIRIGSFLFKFLSAGSVESQYHETVYGALTRDALTGTMNKRYLLESMQREIARSIRQQLALSIMMLDIDHFKQVNDTYGHLAGDDVLREFGGRIASVCREDDLLARYGGEEFCMMLCGTDRDEGLAMAERCREVIASIPFETSVGPLPITASFGLATFVGSPAIRSPAISPTTLIERADKKLYEAKRAGRNRVCG